MHQIETLPVDRHRSPLVSTLGDQYPLGGMDMAEDGAPKRCRRRLFSTRAHRRSVVQRRIRFPRVLNKTNTVDLVRSQSRATKCARKTGGTPESCDSDHRRSCNRAIGRDYR